jgi:hypothetical protein
MTNSQVIAAPKAPPPFEEHARIVMGRIRTSLSEIFTELDLNPSRPQEVARRLGLDKNLTWKISKILRDHDAASSFTYLPGKGGLAILLETLKKTGASIPALVEVKTAFNDLEELIDLHAGDRETFAMMLAGLARSTDGQQQAEAQRKLSFKGNSATWGVQASIQVCTNFIAPGSDDRKIDLAWLSGLIGFWRLRRDVPWAMAAARKTADDGSSLPEGEIRAIDSRHDHTGAVPLLADFCSQPLPEIRTERNHDGVLRYELAEGRVGNAATTTCIIGLFGRNFVARYRAPNDTRGEHFARLYTPVETLIHDLFVHRDLTYALSPQILLYSQMPGGPVFPFASRDRGQLAIYDPIIKLGGSPPDLVTPEISFYPRMIGSVFTRMGWNANDFHGFRFRLRYPPIPAVALWRYDLPDAP